MSGIRALLECISVTGLDGIPIGLTSEQVDYYCNLFIEGLSGKGLLQRKVFKPHIVKRGKGQCQILFPLSELDNICDEIIANLVVERLKNDTSD